MILPLEKQVCSLELAKKLKELGVRQESIFYWEKRDGWELVDDPYDDQFELYSAFTVAELGELLEIHRGEGRPQYAEETESDYKAKMLIHLIKEGIVKTDEQKD